MFACDQTPHIPNQPDRERENENKKKKEKKRGESILKMNICSM